MTPSPSPSPSVPLPRPFYDRSALIVARELLGARLVRQEADGRRIVGRIVETEAYTGVDDMASHSYRRMTRRNAPMWEEPGHTYVYAIHGSHWMFNVTAESEGQPAAVLIRAIEPLEGQDLIAARRAGRKPKPPKAFTVAATATSANTAALGITGILNRADVTRRESGLWLEPDLALADAEIATGPRIGLGVRVLEPWLSIPWRFWIAGNPHVSR